MKKVIIALCFLPRFVFPQKVLLQVSAGNSFFIQPETKTGLLSPAAEAIFYSTFETDSDKIKLFFFGGISYHRSTQQFDVYYPTNTKPELVTDNFYTNEFLFHTGGAERFQLSPVLYLQPALGIQLGPNYTWTTESAGSITLYHLHSNQNPQAINTFLAAKKGNYYTLKPHEQHYTWEYLQCYAIAKLQLIYKCSRRANVLLNFSLQKFLFRNNISEEADRYIAFNYAPVKIAASAGLEIKLFK